MPREALSRLIPDRLRPRPRSAACLLALGLCSLLCSCAAPQPGDAASDQPARPKTSVRFHLADAQPREGFEERQDERGAVLHVNPTPELTEDDVEFAAALHGKSGSFVQITFDRLASQRLRDLTRANLRKRLAIYVDDELLASPLILSELSSGQANLSGDWSRERAEEIARALTRPLPRD